MTHHHHHDDVHHDDVHVHDVHVYDEGHAAASGMNLLTTIIVLVVLAAILWFLFSGPLQGIFGARGGGATIEVNPPAIEQPQQQVPPQQEQEQQQPGQTNPTSMLPDDLRWTS